MQPVSTKLAVGSSVGASTVGVSVVVIWLLGLVHVTVPPDVAAVLAGWFASAAGLLAGYMKREFNMPTDSPTPAPSPESSQGPVP